LVSGHIGESEEREEVKSAVPRFATALLAILILAALLLSLGQRETEAHPSASSYNPSGLHALQELLQRNGVPTVVDRLNQPMLKPNDLVIAAYIESGPDIFGRKPLEEIEKSLKSFMQNGGRVLVIPFDPDFRQRSYEAVKATIPVVNPSSNDTLQVNTSAPTFGRLSTSGESVSSSMATFLTLDYQDFHYSPWLLRAKNSGEPFAVLMVNGKGILARTTDGLFATNRFLDRADNADLALRMISGLVPEGGRVVFTEASLGKGIENSLVNTLGPWATGGYIQALALFLVVVLTLGTRFGLPEIEKRKQAGQREMIDAIADVYRRAKSTAVALDSAYVEADLRIRRGLKIPANATESQRNELLPPELLRTMNEVGTLRKPHIEVDTKGRQRVTYLANPDEAIKLIRRLEQQLENFVPKAKNQIS
jgi:hypothetical protein